MHIESIVLTATQFRVFPQRANDRELVNGESRMPHNDFSFPSAQPLQFLRVVNE